MTKKKKIVFMGGNQVGIIGFLSLMAKGYDIAAMVAYSQDLAKIARTFSVPCYETIKDENFKKAAKNAGLLVSVHGREIVNAEMLAMCGRAINVHPYLYKYKGANPVGRALAERNFNASVGVHNMTENLDEGEVIVEEFVDVSGASTVNEIYEKLYSYYCVALLKALKSI